MKTEIDRIKQTIAKLEADRNCSGAADVKATIQGQINVWKVALSMYEQTGPKIDQN